VGYVNLLETVTDRNGRFSFPAWGPRIASNGKIRLSAPVLLLFKQGYKYGVFANNGRSTENAPEDLKSDWNNRLIPLTKFVGTAQQYDDNLRNLETIFILDLDSNGPTYQDSCVQLCIKGTLTIRKGHLLHKLERIGSRPTELSANPVDGAKCV
jgi:hypothetical protein